MGFDASGDYLAVGDQGGRIVIFERKDGKHVRISLQSSQFFKISSQTCMDTRFLVSVCVCKKEF